MKDILLVIGGIVAAFLFITGVLVVTVMVLIKIYVPKAKRFFGKQVETFQEAITQTHDFARASVITVLSDWQADELLNRATPQFLESLAGGDLAAMFLPWQQSFGGLVACGEMVFKENFASGQLPDQAWNFTAIATATYLTEVQFERGTATVEVQVIKCRDTWSINTFNLITTTALLHLGQPTTLEALQKQELHSKQLEKTINVSAIEPSSDRDQP